ncbi:molybdopterin-dependent oxidoreductase [Halorientalis marina]|jgi:cytochrome b561|uniref:molybdopterin-dependent oxidoreductase n=1 Tax=Halorientalis marina TaxID=2931976 RepID=UPI001FF15FBB|nr:molybdopterin-dependent oxidoreductase [Halorientalis marina]
MADRRRRLEPPPRLVDWSILALVAFEVGSGLVSLTVGTPDGAWLFTLHALAGLTLVGLLGWKFRRVRRRVTDRSLWDGATPVSILLGTLAVAALATGVYWTLSGPVWVLAWPLLTVHMALGLLVVPVLAWHLRHRFRLPTRRDVEGRRTALQYTALLGGGALAWRAQEAVGDALGRERRFTGSKEEGSGDGNDFPVTSWVADDPDPVDTGDWALTVDGEVERALELDYAAVTPGPADADGADAPIDATDERALLDCTSGWYSEHDWRGVRVGDLLDEAGATDRARWVRFESVTGYRWSLPVAEARDALLATHVDGDRLSHGHGAPLRLVAPGRRGFQWVKWVTRIEVRRRQDLGQWLAVFVSGLD